MEIQAFRDPKDQASGHRSLSFSGHRALIGVPWDDDYGDYSGSAYVFVWNGSTWSEKQKLTASDAATDGEFGRSVSVDDGTAVFGATAVNPPSGM